MSRMSWVFIVTVMLLCVVFVAMFTEVAQAGNNSTSHYFTSAIGYIPVFVFLPILISLGMGTYLCVSEGRK